VWAESPPPPPSERDGIVRSVRHRQRLSFRRRDTVRVWIGGSTAAGRKSVGGLAYSTFLDRTEEIATGLRKHHRTYLSVWSIQSRRAVASRALPRKDAKLRRILPKSEDLYFRLGRHATNFSRSGGILQSSPLRSVGRATCIYRQRVFEEAGSNGVGWREREGFPQSPSLLLDLAIALMSC
jgi:hypothetical protein